MKQYVDPKFYDIAARNGITRNQFYTRVYTNGWTPEEASIKPITRKKRVPEHIKSILESNGIPINTYNSRVNKLGWAEEKAINTPPLQRGMWEKKKRTVETDKTKYLKIALENGISKSTFYARVCTLHWSLHEAATRPIDTTKYKKERCA